MENIHIGAACSYDEIQTYTDLFKELHDVFYRPYEEISSIDPQIFIHEIKTYPEAKLVRQKLCHLHPRKFVVINSEFEKLLKTSFIYLVLLTNWVSNMILITKKQGTICVCVDYRDINRVCLKDNYPIPSIEQIIDYCISCEIFSFMDGFSGYNQINILPLDHHKTSFICPWGTFTYQKLPFSLKNVGDTFQRAMSYAFHNIKHIVQPCIDDLHSHSMQLQDNSTNLRAIFLRC
jgi:hypothetical protein